MPEVATKKGGKCMAVPDTCKTPAPPAPPPPMPYSNGAELPMANPAPLNVLIEGKEPIVEDSKISLSSMDEPGSAGGVVSGQNMGEVAFKTTSAKVYFGGKKGVLLGATTGQNGSNANAPAGTLVLVANMKVVADS